METWSKNKADTDEFNENAEADGETFFEACTVLCCYTDDEMVEKREGALVPEGEDDAAEVARIKKYRFNSEFFQDLPVVILPRAKASEVNHVADGNDPPIKNQGGCGSCWAFGVMGVIEAAFKIAGGDMLDTSEQALVDCDKRNKGCNGGWLSTAIDWVKNNGVFLEENYPYRAKNQSCQKGTPLAGYKVDGYKSMASGESQLMAAVEKQPIAVAVNASKWHLYGGGIVNDANWCSGGINHAVNVVGYGNVNGTNYWLVRNSWGTGWGESGYIRLKMGVSSNGICHVARYGYWPNVTVTNPEPKPEPKPEPEPEPSPEPEPKPEPTPGPSDETCKKCDKRWWKNWDCILCLLKEKASKHKWFKADMSNLTPEQEKLLASDLAEMKLEFEASLEKDQQ